MRFYVVSRKVKALTKEGLAKTNASTKNATIKKA